MRRKRGKRWSIDGKRENEEGGGGGIEKYNYYENCRKLGVGHVRQSLGMLDLKRNELCKPENHKS